jgi:hypothetical protein
MNISKFIELLTPELSPDDIKIHIASFNGTDDPLDVYLAGDFDEWQKWQSKKNFSRNYVISFIALPEANTWLFAGLFKVNDTPELHPAPWDESVQNWYYNLTEDERLKEFNGRIVCSFIRPGRQAYLQAEKWIEQFSLQEIYPTKKTIGTFPGYKNLLISKDMLDIIVKQEIQSWRTALESVAGVYLISDKLTGKLYVGSATGEGGIWQRWVEYSKTGHGGNIELKKLLLDDSDARSKDFSFSVLEIADTHASIDQILSRESHWKNVLQTRGINGLNAN